MKGSLHRFWALDRTVTWDAWASLVAVVVLGQGLRWLTGRPEHVPVAMRMAVAAVSLLLACSRSTGATRCLHDARATGA